MPQRSVGRYSAGEEICFSYGDKDAEFSYSTLKTDQTGVLSYHGGTVIKPTSAFPLRHDIRNSEIAVFRQQLTAGTSGDPDVQVDKDGPRVRAM